MVNTFRVSASWGEDPVDVATDVANAYMDPASFPVLMSDTFSVDQYIVGKVESAFLGHPFSGSIGPATTGDVSALILAPQAALVITKRSAIGGHKGRGRMFLPGLTGLSANADHTAWAASEFTAIDGAVQNFFGLINNGAVTSGMTLPNGTSSDPITVTELAHQTYFGTQRRRATAAF